MSFVVNAIASVVEAVGDVVGGAVEIVGDVVEGAVELAGDVIETIAENPLLIAAAIAAPYIYPAIMGAGAAGTVAGGVATGAGVGTGAAGAGALAGGVSASSMGLIGPTLMGAVGATPAALASAGFAAGAGAGVLGGGALAGGLTLLPAATYLGSVAVSAGGYMADALAFPTVTQATNYSTSILNASNESLMTFNQSQTVASTTLANQPAAVFNSNYLSPEVFTQAKEAVSLVKSPGISFSEALANTSGIVPNAPTNMFAQAWDTAKGVVNTINDVSAQADKLLNSIGQTIAPGADPLIQKTITNTAVNTVANGGDFESALKGSIIGTGAGVVGGKVAGMSVDSVGKTGANILGKTAENATGTALMGGDVGQSLLNSGVRAGAGLTSGYVSDLTDSKILGGAAGNAVGTALSGGDVGASLVNSGIKAGVGYAGKGVTDLTSSPLLGGAVRTAIGTGLTGGDVGGALTNFGKNALVGEGNNYLNTLLKENNISAKSPLGMIAKGATPALSNLITGAPPPSASSILKSSGVTKALSSSAPSKTTAPTVLAAAQKTTKAPPPQKVDVSTLTPVSDISSLIGKKP
jgi:hypothetical protein